MEEIPVIGNNFDTICRLCMSNGLRMIGIFTFSSSLSKQNIADIIMECAPVQITQRDEMPKFICGLCYSQLEKNHQFQMQAVHSDRILRRCLEKLHASADNQTKLDCSIQRSSEDPLIHNTISEVVVKCEPLELYDIPETDINWKEKAFPNMNSEDKIKDESAFNPLIPVEYTDCSKGGGNNIKCESTVKVDIDSSKVDEDATFNWKEKVPANFSPGSKNNEKLFLKSEIQDEPTIFIDRDNTNSSNDRKIDDCHTSGNFVWIRSDITECYQKEENKNTLVKCEKNKKANKKKTDKKIYPCDVCSATFTRTNQLKNHKLKHTGEQQYQCNICKKSFVTMGQLKIHQKRVHTDEKPYQCDICNKRFNAPCNLERHKLTHTGEKRYQCDLCNKNFPRSDSLILHKRIHTGEKQYQCDVCNMRFRILGTLNKHKRTHTGEKPYQCDVCKRSFTESGTLKTHKRVHTGEKPYQCDVCNKCFSLPLTLKFHKNTHTNEEPYQCNVCNKGFKNPCNLSKHKRVHTDEKPYKCDENL